MSGGNSGGYIPSPTTKFDCQNGEILTRLSNIDPDVLNQHQVGNVLDVSIIDNSVVVENENGEILGSILHINVSELKECIEGGNDYSAEIIEIINSICRVKISII